MPRPKRITSGETPGDTVYRPVNAPRRVPQTDRQTRSSTASVITVVVPKAEDEDVPMEDVDDASEGPEEADGPNPDDTLGQDNTDSDKVETEDEEDLPGPSAAKGEDAVSPEATNDSDAGSPSTTSVSEDAVQPSYMSAFVTRDRSEDGVTTALHLHIYATHPSSRAKLASILNTDPAHPVLDQRKLFESVFNIIGVGSALLSSGLQRSPKYCRQTADGSHDTITFRAKDDRVLVKARKGSEGEVYLISIATRAGLSKRGEMAEQDLGGSSLYPMDQFYPGASSVPMNTFGVTVPTGLSLAQAVAAMRLANEGGTGDGNADPEFTLTSALDFQGDTEVETLTEDVLAEFLDALDGPAEGISAAADEDI